MIFFFPASYWLKKRELFPLNFYILVKLNNLNSNTTSILTGTNAVFLIKIIKLNLLVIKVKYLFSFFLIHLKNT